MGFRYQVRVWRLGFRVEDLRFRFWELGGRISGLVRVLDLGFRVWDLEGRTGFWSLDLGLKLDFRVDDSSLRLWDLGDIEITVWQEIWQLPSCPPVSTLQASFEVALKA